MDSFALIQRLHEHRQWVNRQLMDSAKQLTDEQLHRSFPMGQGSIWKSLTHLYAAEYVWLEGRQRQVKTILAALPEEGWVRVSAGAGTKGPRWYDWYGLSLVAPWQPGWCRWLLVRRQISAPGELTAYVVFAPGETPLERAVEVAGSRWRVEQCFEEAKGEVGLADYEVRSWTGWYRHITLALWAYALLTALRVQHLPRAALWVKKGRRCQASSLRAFKASRGLMCP